MARKKASEIFAQVDPGLHVIDAGFRGRRRGKRAKKLSEVASSEPEPYNPKPTNDDDWNNAKGEICPVCGEETQQLIPYGFTKRRKACPKCIERRTKLLEYKGRLAEYEGRLAAARIGQRYERGIL